MFSSFDQPTEEPVDPPPKRGALKVVLVLAAVGIVIVGGTLVYQAKKPQAETATALSGHQGAAGETSWTPWPQALHDAQHTSASPFKGPATADLRWTRKLEGDVTPGPVIGSDGTIYAASNGGVLHAIDPTTGEDQWTVDGRSAYGLDVSTSPAVLPNGLILWPGPGDALWALSPAGEELWQLPLGGTVSSPAVTSEGEVTVGDSNGTLVVLRPTEGGPGVQWKIDLGEASYGSPVWSSDGQTVYQSLLSGVIAARDGSVLWQSTGITDLVEVSPAVAPDGTIVIGTNDPYQYGLDPTDGSVLWRFKRGVWTFSSPGVTSDGIAYFGDHANRITGLDAATGRVLFRFQGSKKNARVGGIGIWTSILVDADHSVYAGNRQGYIYSVDRDGKLRWQFDAEATIQSYPALTDDGTLIVGVTDGRLLAFGTS